MTDFSKLNFGVDGDSITAGQQWSWHVYNELGMKSHSNVAVGSAVWYKRTFDVAGTAVTTQDYSDPDFAGISDGWEPTDDPAEMQRRANNCAVVHIQRFLAEVKSGSFPTPDIFAFAMGTNDLEEFIGDPERRSAASSFPIMRISTSSRRQARRAGAYRRYRRTSRSAGYSCSRPFRLPHRSTTARWKRP